MAEKLCAYDRMIRAKAQLGRPDGGQPFFAYLVLHLNCIETDTVPSMAVDMRGNLYYNAKFVESITEEQIQGVLCHEVMHVVLNHMERTGGRIHSMFNIANDIVDNDILVTSNIKLPEPGLIPKNHVFEDAKSGIKIIDIDKKSSEEIYDEIYKIAKQKGMIKKVTIRIPGDGTGKGSGGSGGTGGTSGGNGKGSDDPIGDLDKKRFDEHRYADGKNDKDGKEDGKDGKGGSNGKNGLPNSNTEIPSPITDEERQKLHDKWKKALAEAATYAKQRGLLPAGLERMVDGLLDSKVDWRHKLYKQISNEVLSDFTWAKPHKKCASLGGNIYLPNVTRESLEIVVHIDTSGSIGQEELKEFLSEVVEIGRSFMNIKMDIIAGDAELQDHYTVTHNNSEEIINYKIHGGGGTSHEFARKWLHDNKPEAKIFISLTDGFSDIQSVYPHLPENLIKIIVMPANSAPEEEMSKYGEVIKIDRIGNNDGDGY
jgi:predicted metal-dependent peptidase